MGLMGKTFRRGEFRDDKTFRKVRERSKTDHKFRKDRRTVSEPKEQDADV